jgi:pimeloyl-ACP methyl ester carboxylesterase
MLPNNHPPIVFIHGLWLHGESWHKWLELFHQNGYSAIAASWPGDGATTEATRQNPNAVAGYGVTEIANHVAKQLQQFQQQPILIGHSFGGVIAQNLLGRNLATAAIAIDPAPIRAYQSYPFQHSNLPSPCWEIPVTSSVLSPSPSHSFALVSPMLFPDRKPESCTNCMQCQPQGDRYFRLLRLHLTPIQR